MDELEFVDEEEAAITREFLELGRVIGKGSKISAKVEQIRSLVVTACETWSGNKCEDPGDYLNSLHERVSPDQLNQLRLFVISELNSCRAVQVEFFRAAEDLLNTIVGNELVMQTRINLSIQLPGDGSSLLPLHSDVWSGDSPFEVVVWIPLVDCFRTKSMFILPPHARDKAFPDASIPLNVSVSEIFDSISDHVEWINIPYGDVMLFNQTLPHGNTINFESETRWSLNCRFKSLFAPYGKKGLGEFFEPIMLRAATRVGLEYPGVEWRDDS